MRFLPLPTPGLRWNATGLSGVWNPGAARIFGHRAEEALGQSLDLIIPGSAQSAPD
jgi:PAS domain-containing protein